MWAGRAWAFTELPETQLRQDVATWGFRGLGLVLGCAIVPDERAGFCSILQIGQAVLIRKPLNPKPYTFKPPTLHLKVEISIPKP